MIKIKLKLLLPGLSALLLLGALPRANAEEEDTCPAFVKGVTIVGDATLNMLWNWLFGCPPAPPPPPPLTTKQQELLGLTLFLERLIKEQGPDGGGASTPSEAASTSEAKTAAEAVDNVNGARAGQAQ